MKAIRFASAQYLITVTLALLLGLVVATLLSGCAAAMTKEEASAHEAASVAQSKRAWEVSTTTTDTTTSSTSSTSSSNVTNSSYNTSN